MKGFSIIIVTWNALEHLKTFLPSVTETDYPDYEIIIADNASTDGSREWVEEQFPQVKVATFDANYGYCGGNNRAVEFAEKEILLFLNNDVLVEKNWLHGLNACFEDEHIAAAQPKMRSYESPESFEYAGAGGGFIDKYGYPFCRGRIFDAVEQDEGQYDDPVELFWASGAALAVRKSLFQEVQGFDEDFEFHMEEIDLCWRLQNLSYKITYAPGSVVYHLGGGSLPMGSPRKVYYNFRNSLYMLWKNLSAFYLLRRFPIRLMLDVVAAYKALFSGKPREWWAIAKAHIHFTRHLVALQRKRKTLKKARITPYEPSTMKKYSILWKYFIRGIHSYRDLND